MWIFEFLPDSTVCITCIHLTWQIQYFSEGSFVWADQLKSRSDSLEDETPVGSTSMLFAVLVCFRQYQFVFRTGMQWAVLVCCGQYRYCPQHTGIIQIIPVLPSSYRYCPDHTGTAQRIPVSKTNRYCPEHTSTVQSISVLPRCFILQAVWTLNIVLFISQCVGDSGDPLEHSWLRIELEDGGIKSKHFPINRTMITTAKTFIKKGVPCSFT